MTVAFEQFHQQIKTAELPDLGAAPRRDVLSPDQLAGIVDGFLVQVEAASKNRDLIRSLVLLWHDQLDAAHRIAQEIENVDGSLVHGIIHRREPDFSNARYWFHRVGRHSCFPKLAATVVGMTEFKGTGGLGRKLVHNGEWNALGFIEACEQVVGCPASDPGPRWLRTIQAVEFELLLEHFCEPTLSPN